jgi:hypothetical protein
MRLVRLALVGLVVAACSSAQPPVDAYVAPDAFVVSNDAGADDAASAIDATTTDAPAVDAASANDADIDATNASCVDSADVAVQDSSTFASSLQNCGTSTFGAEPAMMNCIVGLGLSTTCAGCYDTDIHCAIRHCAGPCSGGNTPQCTSCRAQFCNADFVQCSGRPP